MEGVGSCGVKSVQGVNLPEQQINADSTNYYAPPQNQVSDEELGKLRLCEWLTLSAVELETYKNALSDKTANDVLLATANIICHHGALPEIDDKISHNQYKQLALILTIRIDALGESNQNACQEMALLAKIYFIRLNNDTAGKLYAVASLKEMARLPENESQHSRNYIASTFNDTANTLSSRGYYAAAIYIYEIAVDLYTKLDNQECIAEVCHNMGLTYNKMGEYTQAKECFESAISIRKTLENKGNLADSLYSCAIARLWLGDISRAENYFGRVINIQNDLQYTDAKKAQTMTNIAAKLCLHKKYESAIKYYKDAINIYNKMPAHNSHIANISKELSYLYAMTKNYKNAIKYALDIVELYDKNRLEYDRIIARQFYNIALAYVQLGDYNSAALYLEYISCLVPAKKLKDEDKLNGNINNLQGIVNNARQNTPARV